MNYNTILPPFKWFIIENFPYIEEDFDALTNWQLFCKLGKEMNKIIEKCNLTGEQVENLTNAFNSLKAYIDNYFDTLDLQEEVNAKLDEMAESGELEEIIASYLNTNALLTFATLNDLKQATNLIAGSKVKTFGYNAVNDGGGSLYNVRQVLNTDTENDMDIVALSDENLVAEYIPTGIINAKQFGAKGDKVHNDTENLQKVIDYAKDNKLQVFIPAGDYLIDHLDIYGGINVTGVNKNKSRLYTTNNINYDYAINVSGLYTKISDLSLIGTSDGEYDASAHVQNGIGFTTTYENYAGRLNINNVEIMMFTGSGIYNNASFGGYLADSEFNYLKVSDNEKYGMYLGYGSDFSIINSYFANNRFTGCHTQVSNCRFINNKYYLNGVGIFNGDDSTAQTRYPGCYMTSTANIMTGCSAQENYGDGFKFENVSNSVLSNLTSDANGILGWTTNPYDLQHHGDTRVARTESTVTNVYVGFRFKTVNGTNANGLTALSFIDTNTYGVQMQYLFYFEDEITMNLSGMGGVANTSEYNYDFNFGSNIIEINQRLLGRFSTIFEDRTSFTISNISTGASTGSFRINVPNWAQGVCLVKLSKGGSLYDMLVISCSRTNNGVVSAKVSNQDYYTLTNGSDYVQVNINNGGIYGATVHTIN